MEHILQPRSLPFLLITKSQSGEGITSARFTETRDPVSRKGLTYTPQSQYLISPLTGKLSKRERCIHAERVADLNTQHEVIRTDIVESNVKFANAIFMDLIHSKRDDSRDLQ
jgi:hypothetical protein